MKERWDIEVLFQNGPYADHRTRVYKGPTVIIGSAPDVGGIRINKISIAPIHARIDCYDGKRVMIHPIEHNEVRVASHKHEDWNRIDPLYKPVPLQDGNVVYIGSLGHGIMFTFVRAKTFQWKEEQISSLIDPNAQMAISIANNTKASTIHTSNYPKWFFPSLAGMISVTLILLFIRVLNVWAPEAPSIGPRYEGTPETINIDLEEEVETSILQGFQAPFEDFVMIHNQRESGIANLSGNASMWDKVLYESTLKTIKATSRWYGFWKQLEVAKSDYSMVVDSLRDANLPEVFAGVPFQETKYKNHLMSFVCAAGIWQFMPETGIRMGLDVRDCKIDVTGQLWSPTERAPPYNVRKNAKYVQYNSSTNSARCKIGNSKRGSSCAVDDRLNVQKSTKAAMALLRDTYDDQELAESGSLVQMTILAHNAGYNDELYLGRVKAYNVLPAYRRYRNSNKKLKNGVRFYGDNICPKPKKDANGRKIKDPNCKSFLAGETQHYGYKAIAYHILAVCYYAKNYPGDPIFSAWEGYLNGYCKDVHAPERK